MRCARPAVVLVLMALLAVAASAVGLGASSVDASSYIYDRDSPDGPPAVRAGIDPVADLVEQPGGAARGRSAYGYDDAANLSRASGLPGGYRLAPRALPAGPRLAEIGPAGNPGLVGRGSYSGGGVLRHYSDDVGRAGIEGSGVIRPGADGRVYVTPTRYGSGAQAQAEIAFGRTPTGYFEIPESRLPGLQGPHRVDPWGGQPGGGVECWVTCPVNAEGLKWFPIEP